MADVTLTGLSVTSAEGILTPPNEGEVELTLSGYEINIVAGAQGVLAIYEGTYILQAYGHTGGEDNGAHLELSGYSFYARSGGGALLELTVPTVTITGTSTQLGEVVVALSGYSHTISGTTDVNGRARLVHNGHYTHTIRGGARIVVELSGYGVAGSDSGGTGTVDRLAGVVGTLPRCTIYVHGIVDNHGEVVGTLPTLTPVPSGVLIARLPRALLLITGTTGTVGEYEAYSLTFFGEDPNMDVATTRYTTYPFDRFVRFNNLYYGMSADGLYEIGGDDFDGTPIVAVVKTPPTDFKVDRLKRPISLYIGGEVGADFRVTVTSALVRDDKYMYRPVDKTGARNYRVFFGKGIRARYLAYTLTNIDGGDFVLDDISPEIVVLQRTA